MEKQKQSESSRVNESVFIKQVSESFKGTFFPTEERFELPCILLFLASYLIVD